MFNALLPCFLVSFFVHYRRFAPWSGYVERTDSSGSMVSHTPRLDLTITITLFLRNYDRNHAGIRPPHAPCPVLLPSLP